MFQAFPTFILNEKEEADSLLPSHWNQPFYFLSAFPLPISIALLFFQQYIMIGRTYFAICFIWEVAIYFDHLTFIF